MGIGGIHFLTDITVIDIVILFYTFLYEAFTSVLFEDYPLHLLWVEPIAQFLRKEFCSISLFLYICTLALYIKYSAVV